MKNRETRGFTLIELLVVIAIIGILSSVVLASLNSARVKGRDARRISDLKQLQLALELYYDATGSEYPDALSSLATTYIAAVPTDPSSSSTQYEYSNLTSSQGQCQISDPAFCTSYILGANMEGPVPAGDVDGSQDGGNINCADGTPGSNPNKYCVRP